MFVVRTLSLSIPVSAYKLKLRKKLKPNLLQLLLSGHQHLNNKKVQIRPHSVKMLRPVEPLLLNIKVQTLQSYVYINIYKFKIILFLVASIFVTKKYY